MNLTVHGTVVICSDLEFIKLPNGTELCKFSVVTNKTVKEKKYSSFFTALAWSKTALFAHKNLKIGARICIDGEIQNNTYVNKEGRKVSYPEISIKTLTPITYGGKNASAQANGQQPNYQQPNQNTGYQQQPQQPIYQGPTTPSADYFDHTPQNEMDITPDDYVSGSPFKEIPDF